MARRAKPRGVGEDEAAVGEPQHRGVDVGVERVHLRSRSCCRFRERGTEYASESGIKWMSERTFGHDQLAPSSSEVAVTRPRHLSAARSDGPGRPERKLATSAPFAALRGTRRMPTPAASVLRGPAR